MAISYRLYEIFGLGYGNQIEHIENKPYLILDKTKIISYPITIENDILKLFANSFTVNKNIIIVIGIIFIIFAMVFLQTFTASLIGLTLFVLVWHIIYIGNFLASLFLALVR